MKILNLIKIILKLPFALIVFPIWATMGFFMTDWENEYDRNHYKKSLKDIFL